MDRLPFAFAAAAFAFFAFSFNAFASAAGVLFLAVVRARPFVPDVHAVVRRSAIAL